MHVRPPPGYRHECPCWQFRSYTEIRGNRWPRDDVRRVAQFIGYLRGENRPCRRARRTHVALLHAAARDLSRYEAYLSWRASVRSIDGVSVVLAPQSVMYLATTEPREPSPSVVIVPRPGSANSNTKEQKYLGRTFELYK